MNKQDAKKFQAQINGERKVRNKMCFNVETYKGNTFRLDTTSKSSWPPLIILYRLQVVCTAQSALHDRCYTATYIPATAFFKLKCNLC